MNDLCYVVLLDTVSIQNYIFSSNKLKENLGASHLVKEIYGTYLSQAIQMITGSALDLDAWKKAESETFECSGAVEIGYIGGGNALLSFPDEASAQLFIKEWTKSLLLHTPGLTTAVAYASFPKHEEFRENLDALFTKLEENKARYSPITALPRHGITAECARSGASAEIWVNDDGVYVSACTNAKIEAASLSNERLEKRYYDKLGNQFCFSDKLEDLGGIRGEDNHIAIVHIDGNDMGDRFQGAQTLKKIRQLSKTVDAATHAAFDAVIEKAIAQKDEKKILPIRSIVLGGDDVTFVCDGKLGIYFAKLFIEALEREKASDEEPLTACAGVAIIPTKYPFYRGVALAKELCANAKKTRKGADGRRPASLDASFLDFHIAMGGVSGTLEKMRKLYFQVPQGSLLYRPFKLVSKESLKESLDEYSLDLFLDKIWELQYNREGKVNLPKNKISELRKVLALSEDAMRKFVQELKYRDRKLPEIEGHQYAETLFTNSLTPYFDMIEILRFYPEFALKEHGEKR